VVSITQKSETQFAAHSPKSNGTVCGSAKLVNPFFNFQNFHFHTIFQPSPSSPTSARNSQLYLLLVFTKWLPIFLTQNLPCDIQIKKSHPSYSSSKTTKFSNTCSQLCKNARILIKNLPGLLISKFSNSIKA